MSSKHETFASRLTCILQRLNLGERINVKQLAEEFGVSTRTIQRDFNERLNFLDWDEQGPNYYSLDKSKLGHLYPEDIERFARFCSIQNLLPRVDRRFYQEQLTQSIKVKGFQYEDITSHQAEFNMLYQAIETRHRIEFNYTKAGSEKGKYYRLEPYALLNRNGIWYLIGIDIEAGKQKTFCFSQISSLMKLTEIFEHDPDLLAAIHDNDSISHGNQLSEVTVRVAAKAAHYFIRRDLLPNQELVRKLEDGGLLLACKNINEMDVIPIIQYWIPHVKILTPVELQHKIEQQLRMYLDI